MSCPQKSRLLAYALDKTDREETAALDDHLSWCRPCLDRFVEAAANPLIPRIEGYHLVREIGRGRFGVVYKAWRLGDTPGVVALKILSDPGDMQMSRFDREIAVLKKIDSPHVVRCIDSGRFQEMAYLVMDHVSGEHLDSYIRSPNRSLEEKLAVFEKVCRAVADAHRAGVVHRDLKPKNILVDSSGNPHVLDFGICAVEQEDWSGLISATITHAGDIIGTLKYMSPEQAWGGGVAGHVDARSDIWSLGIMLYEIVTGGYPYPDAKYRDRPRHEALLEQIRKDLPEIPDLADLPRGKDLRSLLERCLAWEKEYRIHSARYLADDIRRYLDNERVQTRPLRTFYRVRRLAIGAATRSRWTFTFSFVALMFAAVWVGVVVFGMRWHTSAPPTETAADRGFFEAPADHFVIVGIDETAHAPVVDYARRHNIAGVTADRRTWRPVHAALLERLKAHPPRTVVFDYYFASDRPEDDARLASAIADLEKAGTPVVLAALEYEEDATPKLSETLRELRGRRLRHGAIASRPQNNRPGEFVLATQRSGGVVPSLPLATFAALLHPEAIPEINWQGRDMDLEIMYEVEPRLYLRQRDGIRLGQTIEQQITSQGVPEGHVIAVASFALRKPHEWASRTVNYHQLLDCPDDELRATVAGKMLMIGDLHAAFPDEMADRHDVLYDGEMHTDVPGCFLICDAIAGLLGDTRLEVLRILPVKLAVMVLAGTVLGCLLPIPLARLRWLERAAARRIIKLALLAGSAACLIIMWDSRDRATTVAALAGLSVIVPMIGSFWVEFARNRHRVLDNRRKEFLDREKLSSGTLTLGLKPS